jgi:hypothetical protein
MLIPEEKTLHRKQKTEQHARTLLNTRGENTTQKIKDRATCMNSTKYQRRKHYTENKRQNNMQELY